MKISIAAPGCVDRLGVIEGGWIYADDDLEVFHLVRDALGKLSSLVSAEVFQQTALEFQAPFVQWVDECMDRTPRDSWLATPLSKNPFESRLFLHLVWMVLIDQSIKHGESKITVVTASHGLALALSDLCRIRGWECKRHGKIKHLFLHWCHHLVALAKWFGKLLLLGYKTILARRVFTREYVATRLAGTELLLETYVHDGDMGRDGSCKDRYFPGLMAYYRSQGIKASYFPLLYHIPLQRLRETFIAMKRSEIPFLPFEAVITFRDIVQAAWASMRYGLVSFLPSRLLFQGVPVDSLIRTERFSAGLRGVIPFALTCAPRRMAEAGIKPKWFIDWFENQILDKGVVLGLKEGLPECRPVAVRQYVFSSNILSLFSSLGEIRAGVAPAENWVCGEALMPIASRHDSVGIYSAVPALRYSYLHQLTPAAERGDALLVLLTHSVEESMGILDCVAPLCRVEGTGTSHLVIKTHPDMDLAAFRERAERRFSELESNAVEWTSLKLNELLPSAKVVVTSGSSAAVESICQGIPVVLVGRQAGLNFNPLEGIDSNMWTIAYTTNELRDAIIQRFGEDKLSSAERLDIAENARNGFFMGTENDEMHRFLPMEK
jgi:hypothetical protein